MTPSRIGPFFRRDRAQWLLFAIAAGLVATAVFVAAGQYGVGQADESVLRQGQTAAQLQVSSLVSELDKQRAVRFAVAHDAEVIATLQDPATPALDRLDAKLEALNDAAGANVIYIVNRNGLALASSNYRSETSFVGNDYQFRRYFREAMAEGTAQLFALGTVSRRPGLYIAERIESPDGPLGVAVVKLEFDALEALWERSGGATYVADNRGIVLLTSMPEWQFYSLKPLNEQQVSELRADLQYEAAPLSALPVGRHDGAIVQATLPSGPGPQLFAEMSLAVPSIDWMLTMLLPVEPERTAGAAATRAVALLALVPLFGIAALVLGMSQRARRTRVRLATQREELEKAVRNAIDERYEAEAKATRLRDDLAQSNRLAILGQISAGVAHEINQPLSAIRAYSENGVLLIEREEHTRAAENLRSITGLSDRLAAITEHLRGFARKGESRVQALDVRVPIEAALTLLSSSIRSADVEIRYASPPQPVLVLADEMGIEQIVVNLVRNALDALLETKGAQISMTIVEQVDIVKLQVADNGPGIAPDVMEQLFIPFNSSKTKGLGLGLVISQDLAQSFGGGLTAGAGEGGGALFTLTLRRAR